MNTRIPRRLERGDTWVWTRWPAGACARRPALSSHQPAPDSASALAPAPPSKLWMSENLQGLGRGGRKTFKQNLILASSWHKTKLPRRA